MREDGDILKARIDVETKREFNDIFPNMSEKVIEMVKDAINQEKEKYLPEFLHYFPDSKKCIEALGVIIDKLFDQSVACQVPEDEINLFSSVKEAIAKEYGEIDARVYHAVYNRLINGLYFGDKKKDNTFTRIERLYRNKTRLQQYLNKKGLEGYHG